MKQILAGVTLYDVPEIAKILNITEGTIRRFIRERRLHASYKLGRKLWISEEDFKAFLAAARIDGWDKDK